MATPVLQCKVIQTDERTDIALSGRIDESTAAILAASFEQLRPLVRLNLRHVTHVSSYGMGALMRHLSAIRRNHRVEFAECSETMVDQFQMLEFSNYGRITSFMMRYACERCDRQEPVLLDIDRDLEVDLATREVRSPVFHCSCGGRRVADDSLDFVVEHLPG